MKKGSKSSDFLNFLHIKQELDRRVELKKKQTIEKPLNVNEFFKFKTEIFIEVRELIQKMQIWMNEGLSQEELSLLLAGLKEKKEDNWNTLQEEARQNYINEVSRGILKNKGYNMENSYKRCF